jgi:hypothetical protein
MNVELIHSKRVCARVYACDWRYSSASNTSRKASGSGVRSAFRLSALVARFNPYSASSAIRMIQA